jgi:ABC-type transport system involved in multi-copper enzyme maturation permease subunit
MKKYEIAAAVLVVLYVISIVCTPLYTTLLSKFYGAKYFSTMNFYQYATVWLQGFIRLLVQIAIAVWLARQAKKDGASPTIWALFGLLFSVLGTILYFVLRNQADRLTQPGKPNTA